MWKMLRELFGGRAEEPAAGISSSHSMGTADDLQSLRDALSETNLSIATSHLQPLLDALRRKRKIEAIKVLRDGSQSRLSLHDAKEIVDQLESRLPGR